MFFSENSEKAITLTGKTDDLLTVSEDDKFKMTRLVMIKNDDKHNEETITLDFTSFSENMEHTVFDGFIGKNIQISIRTI